MGEASEVREAVERVSVGAEPSNMRAERAEMIRNVISTLTTDWSLSITSQHNN